MYGIIFVEGEDMKKIQFDFIPISFPVKYSDCKKTNFPDVITLFNKFNTKVLLSKTLFNKVDITFIFDEFNSIDDINNLLFERYGVPNMIKYGKTYIWRIDKLYLTHGEEDTYYQDSKHILNLSYVAPFMSIDYSYYMMIDKVIKNILSIWNFKKEAQFISPSKHINYIYETSNFRYVFILKKHKVSLGAHEIWHEGKNKKELIHWKQTSKFKAIKELEIVINSFLSFIEEYDNSLKQNINNL